MLGSYGSINPYHYQNLSSNNSKIYVPVSPSLVIYSQFEHISGFAAGENQQGVAIDKVQILNRLIDQLVSMQNKNVIAKPENNTALNENQVDALIKDYQAKIQDTLALSKAIPYAMGGASAPASGVLFNFAV